MISKVKTIGHYGIIFAETWHELEHVSWDIDGKPYYMGELDRMTYKKASKIAEIHPDFQKYYEMAMMPLFKTYSFKGGTESPKKAIETLKTKKESEIDMPYVIIWKIM